jgi:transposase-like protein
MTTEIAKEQAAQEEPMPDLSVVANQLVAAARRQGVELTGPGGLLTGLTKQVLETALEVELTEHLGHERNERHASTPARRAPIDSRPLSSQPTPLHLTEIQ